MIFQIGQEVTFRSSFDYFWDTQGLKVTDSRWHIAPNSTFSTLLLWTLLLSLFGFEIGIFCLLDALPARANHLPRFVIRVFHLLDGIACHG
jgi:hypothetical protein